MLATCGSLLPFFFFNDTATTEIYTLSLHDALPISILPPRRLLAPCSPRTQEMASTTLDLPDPLGPTTAVIPGSRRRVVADAKDLNPLSVRLDRCTESGS